MGPKTDVSTQLSLVGNDHFGGPLSPVWAWDYRGLLFSQNNHKLPNGSWSGGGGFYTYRSHCSHGERIVMPLTLLGTDFGRWQIQGVAPAPTTPPLTEVGRIASWTDAATAVQSYIPTGYMKTRPGNPTASLGQFLIELRDFPKVPFGKGLFRVTRPSRYGFQTVRGIPFQDIPAALAKNVFSLKNLGSEYLNIVFGWRPLLSDLRKMYRLWATIDKQLAQIVRENGHGINRRATIEDTTDVSPDPVQDFPYPYANVYGGVPGFPSFYGTTRYTKNVSVHTRVWYMAKYQYYIPDVASSQWTSRARTALFGALPTPELLWEVLPWSWLIDWSSNVGDVISNASPNAVDNLVTLYSYTMKHVTTTSQWAAQVFHWPGDGAVWVHPGCDTCFSSTLKEETKLRFPGGSPFVLNSAGSDLTPGQAGVLTALGLSRSGQRYRR